MAIMPAKLTWTVGINAAATIAILGVLLRGTGHSPEQEG
jgi:hypothetical protein